AGLGGGAGLGELDVAERLARREAGRDRGDLDGRAPEGVLRVLDERRVDAQRGDARDRRIAGLRSDRLCGERPDLARRVLALERREVDHPDRQIEGPELRSFLDRALLQRVDPFVDADLVDGADPTEEAAQRPGSPVPGADKLASLLAGE